MPVCRSASFLSCSADGNGCAACPPACPANCPPDESNTMKSLPAPCIFVKSMRMPPRIAESSHRGTIPEHTAIHHSEYPGRDRLLSRRLVNHAILQPKRGQLQSDAVVDDCRNMLRSTE